MTVIVRPPTRVVNIYKDPYDVYCGRAGRGQDGTFGNPHTAGWCSSCRRVHVRDEALALFDIYFEGRITTDDTFRERVRGLAGKRLGCFCKPKRCHVDTIVKWLEGEGLA